MASRLRLELADRGGSMRIVAGQIKVGSVWHVAMPGLTLVSKPDSSVFHPFDSPDLWRRIEFTGVCYFAQRIRARRALART